MKNDFLIILQARTGSTRLPRKMLRPFYKDLTIPEILIDKLSVIFDKKNIVLATSEEANDQKLVDTAKKCGIQYFCGSEKDVLKRFIDCAEKFKVDKVIRICADNPFLLPKYILPIMDEIGGGELEYCSYQWWDKTPVMMSHIGLFAEGITLKFLKKVNSYTDDPFYHEHVTNFIYTHKSQFKYKFLELPEVLKGKEDIRLTVDSEEDFVLAKEIYEETQKINSDVGINELLNVIEAHPDYISKMKSQIERNAK